MSALSLEEVIADFTALVSLATRVMNEHVNDRDLCAVCGCAWPCERVVLAEHKLAFV
ncbi:MAG TPA: hypothetical protein VHX38_25785 [Pseudonocardiaceae bacterium]|nr:hypothetical protein [Pseudonocardiaceae bacterium]